MLTVIALLLMMQLGLFEFYLQRRQSLHSLSQRVPKGHPLLSTAGVADLVSGRFNSDTQHGTSEASKLSVSMARRKTKQGSPISSTLAAKYLKVSQKVVTPPQPSRTTVVAQSNTAIASPPSSTVLSDSRGTSSGRRFVTGQTIKGTQSHSTLHLNTAANMTNLAIPTAAPQILPNWEAKTFCHDFFVNTFIMRAEVCANSSVEKSVECFGNRHSSSMATCTLRNIVVLPSLLLKAVSDPDYLKFTSDEHSIALLKRADTDCVNITTNNLSKRVESGDYVLKMVKKLVEEKTYDTSNCDTWIHETVLLFTAHRFHIYFRFLDYFNVHRLLEDAILKFNVSRIIRISGNDNYKFGWFDQALFPEVRFQTLEDFKSVNTCFKKVVLVPKSYASPVFQCKNRVWLRTSCVNCDGKGKNETHINSFRTRVLKACSRRVDSMDADNNGSLIVLISRSPYMRNNKDSLKNFERILDNENELVTKIRGNFSDSTVHVVHLEKLDICEQVAYAHNADIYLGVHGSGLVHLWWMRDEALVYEMEPHYEVANPTFRMLARLTGRNYHSEFIPGGWKTVHTNVKSVIKNLMKFSKL